MRRFKNEKDEWGIYNQDFDENTDMNQSQARFGWWLKRDYPEYKYEDPIELGSRFTKKYGTELLPPWQNEPPTFMETFIEELIGTGFSTKENVLGKLKTATKGAVDLSKASGVEVPQTKGEGRRLVNEMNQRADRIFKSIGDPIGTLRRLLGLESK